MTAGIEIYNDSGVIQVTDSFRNLQYLGKATTVVSASSGTITLSSNVLFVAYRVESPSWAAMVVNYINTSGQLVISFSGTVGATITYYMFGYPTITAGSMFEVYNASGNLVFSNNNYYMKVIASRSGTITSFSDISDAYGSYVDIETISHSSSVITAILPGKISRRWLVGPHPFVFSQGYVFGTSAVTHRKCCTVAYAQPTDTTEYISPSYNFLVIDVTNL